MRKLFSLFVVFLASTTLWAYDFQSGDLYYNITSHSAPYRVEVTCQNNSSSNYSRLTTVTIPETVTYKGITYNVTRIGEGAFLYCSSLTSLTIPEYITSIGKGAFYYCSSLNSITIPKSVTSIGDFTFDGCTSLTKTNYTGDITSWCNIQFGGFTANPMGYSQNFYINNEELKNLIIPNTATSIGDYAFTGSSLTSVTIGESVTSIGDYAFAGSSLTSVTIGKNVSNIGCGIFLYCSGLTSPIYNANYFVYMPTSFKGAYVIPDSIKKIAGEAFYDCSLITSITIPKSVTSIGDRAFDGCTSLTETNYMGDIASWCKIKFNNYSANPIYYSDNFHIHNQEIKELIIPNIVDSIYDYTFCGCSSLISVIINNSVTNIGKSAFSGCSSVSSLSIGKNITSIGSEAFYNCSSLSSIIVLAEVPPTIETPDAFHNVSTSIPVYVACGQVDPYKSASIWRRFSKIQEPKVEYSIMVDVNDTIMGSATVDNNTFCEGAHISALPNFGYHFVQWSDGNTNNPYTLMLTQDTTLTAEFAQSFSGQCGDSLYWEFSDNTLHITGSGKMYDYNPDTAPWKLHVSSIKTLTIAENVTKIGYEVFNGCSAIETIVWNAIHAMDAESDGQNMYPIFSGICSQIKSFTFGETVEYIPAYLCNGMDKLTSVIIPNSVKTIGTSAFEGCVRLGKVHLGISLEEIAANAFAGCTRLYDIYSFATYPPFAEESSFANYNVYVYIPCEYQRDYILDVVWGKFKFIECIESEEATTDGNITVVPGFNDVTITWPTNENADTYLLVIKKTSETFCTLTFNQEGQLLNIAFAPGRNSKHPVQYAEQTVNGYQFTLTGLTKATQYVYNLTIKDASNKTIATYSGEFRTRSENDCTIIVEHDAMQGQVSGAGTYLVGETITLTAIPNDGFRFVRWSNEVEDNPYTFVVSENVTLSAEFEKVVTTSFAPPHNKLPISNCQKILNEDHIYILREGKIYSIMGQEL